MSDESIPYIDIHAHLNFAAYDTDRQAVLDRMRAAGVYAINVGTQASTSQIAVDMADQHEHLFAIIGLHPIHTDASYHDTDEIGQEGIAFTSRGEVFDSAYYRALAAHSRVVGIGETGLDYYRTSPDSLEKQKAAFHAQIALALECDLPLMLHIRPSQKSYDAYDDVLEILKPYKEIHGDRLRGNVHFFAGTPEIAQAFIGLGFYISFTGVITFASGFKELVKAVPLDRIMSETDCPYVTPEPYRGIRNEPTYVIEVVKRIALWKECSETEVKRTLYENACRLFKIGGRNQTPSTKI
ncbi:MAG: TatD family hydrolase [Candidatus Pacebacteria bacterium]|nr:TatD family hydrolase [Candidatus Paceibacterota bacterium]MCD8508007.1 TatD family hydrolase [Candidatus Paceibacterota bacterium]MCD8564053.1 TatD family hydrolase [Candidatus Paceibacterota bacterium]